MRKLRKPVSLLLALIMVLGMFAIVPISAGAAVTVDYIDENGYPQSHEATELSSGSTSLSAGWYCVSSIVEIGSRITCTGDVHLILCDGATLTAPKGITVNSGSANLSIYGQSGGTGALLINGVRSGYSGIGGSKSNGSGFITINGGTVTAIGGNYSSGIGGGIYFKGGTLDISGSPVITGNTDSHNAASNLYLPYNDSVLTITGELSESARIGVRDENLRSSAFTTGLSGKGNAKNFICDHSGYAVRLNTYGEAIFKEHWSVTIIQPENGSLSVCADTACAGDEITLTVTPNTGYTVKTVTVNGDMLSPDENGYSFIMPGSDIRRLEPV